MVWAGALNNIEGISLSSHGASSYFPPKKKKIDYSWVGLLCPMSLVKVVNS